MIALFLIVLIGGAFVIAVLGSDMADSMSWQRRPKPPPLRKGTDRSAADGPGDGSGAAPDDVEVAHGEDQQSGGSGLMGDSKSERDGL